MWLGQSINRRGAAAFGSLIILVIGAFITRLLPLSFIPYPFNNDSLTECRLASEILSSGHLVFSVNAPWYGTHSGAMPVLNVLLAFLSSALGVTPFQSAQVLDATVATLTISSVYLLGRLISGSVRGGIAAGFSALLLGTFVFTTGSVWKEMLGISLFIFALVGYAHRDKSEFRILTFSILMLLPLVHHLVAAVALLTFAYLLTWSWYFTLAYGRPKKQTFEDSVLIVMPIAWTGLYYMSTGFDKASVFLSPLRMVLLFFSFGLISLIAIGILSMNRHSKWTFAPLVGLALFIIVAIDYLGYLFPYSPSAPVVYLLLGGSSAFLVGMAWYGSEIILERRPLYRAIQIALLVSPLSIIGYGLLGGLSLSSHQIVYRSFDFVDTFIFIGIGMALVYVFDNHRRVYNALGTLMILFLLISFPFAYWSGDLLGVRHDTQAYEVDATEWLADSAPSPWLVTDERLGYIGLSMAGLPKFASLPVDLKNNMSLSSVLFCLVETSWTDVGVNAYPDGKIVLPLSNYTLMLQAGNVYYIGGPSSDQAFIFSTSYMGASTVYHVNG